MGLRGIGARPLNERKEVLALKYKPGSSRAEKVIQFIESLPITSGMLSGSKFLLRDWQKEIIEKIYAVDKKGKRLVREVLFTVPRKNGKTQLAAAVALAHLAGPEAESRGQVYSAAADREQAALIYNEMKAMILETPHLNQRIIIRDFNKHLEDVITGSLYKALSSDAKTKHGFNASFVIYDELAQAPNRELYDTLKTSIGARKEPLIVVISTQSHDPLHIMSELVDHGEKVRDNLVEDHSFLPIIFSAPTDSDPWNEKTWRACNPALGDFRSIEEMRNAAVQARAIPARESSFRLLYLNQRVQAEAGFISQAEWDRCADSVKESELLGAACYGGLDLSEKNDLTALCLMFVLPDGRKAVRSFFWTPKGLLNERVDSERILYESWIRQGYLSAKEGKIIDYEWVAKTLVELARKYDIREIAFDREKIESLKKELNSLGSNLEERMIEHRQGFISMGEALQCLWDDIKSERLRHGANPILTWCVFNAVVIRDAANNMKLIKKTKQNRIDGAVALAMAANLASQPRESEIQFF